MSPAPAIARDRGLTAHQEDQPRLVWLPDDDSDPGWVHTATPAAGLPRVAAAAWQEPEPVGRGVHGFHTAEWEQAADWDIPEGWPASKPAESALPWWAMPNASHAAPPAPAMPEWLVGPAADDAVVEEVTHGLATQAPPAPLRRRRDIRAQRAADVLQSLDFTTPEGLNLAEIAAEATAVLPRRRELRRPAVRPQVVDPTLKARTGQIPAVTAPLAGAPVAEPEAAPETPTQVLPTVTPAPAGSGESPAQELPRRRDVRGGTAPVTEPGRLTRARGSLAQRTPSAVATGAARFGVVSVLVAVGVATVGGPHLHQSGPFHVGDTAARLSSSEAGAALRLAPLPKPTPGVTLWNQRVDPSAMLAAAAKTSPAYLAAKTEAKHRNGVADDLGDAIDKAKAKAKAEKARKAAAAAAKARAEELARAARASTRDPRALARVLVAQRGWSSGQFQCLNLLWNRESGWNYRASNPSSGAYGIPQSLPGSKMASYGSDWRTNPATQIKWGLSYIAGRYGTPCGAWAHSQSTGWY